LPDFQNPQQEPGSERRLLLVFVLSFIVIIAFQPLLKKYGPQTPAPQTQNQPAPKQSVPAPPSNVVASAPAKPAPGGVTKQAAAETETVIENDLYRITFTNRGAQVKSWILKKFDNETQNGPLDLVNTAAAEKYGYPLSLWTYDEGLRNRLNSVLYTASAEGRQTAPASITFEYSDQDLSVRKTFRFDHTYVVNVETTVTSKGAPVPALPAWPAGFGDQVTPANYASALIDYQFNNNIERLSFKCGFFSFVSKCVELSGGNTLPGPFHWAGTTDQYFAAVFIPDDPASASLVTLRNSIPVLRDPSKPDKQTVNMEVLGAAVGNLHGPTIERVFVGPKALDAIESVSVPGIAGAPPDLRGLVDFGWLGLIAKPLFLWLKWTYNHIVHNWGWAIVLQTLIISVALLPLRVSQMKSMLKMQRVQPQIKSIQEKYKKYSLRDPRKAPMNEEISALYKKEGVNPAGGCLPVLIQMPFLFAYYRMLGTALDLRHAHWLWIHDLSARDPYFVLPGLLVVSMLVTQKMTPQAGMDPAQQRMMTVMMPLMMGFIFLNLASGLNLYYGESNLISIAQQAIMNRTTLGREMREMMEKRARKKDK
jgi:YidC/Oxa1 family membrane protein insertase